MFWFYKLIGVFQALWHLLQPRTVPGLIVTALGGGLTLLGGPSMMALLGLWGHSHLSALAALLLSMIGGVGVMSTNAIIFMLATLGTFWYKNGRLPRTERNADWISVIWGGLGFTSLTGFVNGTLSPLVSELFVGLKPAAAIVAVSTITSSSYLAIFLTQSFINAKGARSEGGAPAVLSTPRSHVVKAVAIIPMGLIYLGVLATFLLFLGTAAFLISGKLNTPPNYVLTIWATAISLGVTIVTSSTTNMLPLIAANVQSYRQPKVFRWLHYLPSPYQWTVGISILITCLVGTGVTGAGLPIVFHFLEGENYGHGANQPYQIVLMQWVFIVTGAAQQAVVLAKHRLTSLLAHRMRKQEQ